MKVSGKLFQSLDIVLLGKAISPTLFPLKGKKTLISKPSEKKKEKKKRWKYPERDYQIRREGKGVEKNFFS